MKAAVLRELNAPLSIEQIDTDTPEVGQVLVRVLTAGICGAQLQEIRGEKGGPLPHLLGHEGVGIVQAVGEGVTTVRLNDKVVMHWRKGAGMECPQFPEYFAPRENHWFTSGKVVTFAEYALCSENRLTRVPADTPNDLCALLGCGLSTALACIENDAELRFGETVAVVGCGGLGLNLIRAAKARGAGCITGHDIVDKSDEALGAGACGFTRPSAEWTADVIFDTTGLGAWIERLNPSGRYIFVGQPPRNTAIAMPNALHLFDGDGKTVRATQGGGFQPARDVPRYVELWRSGRLRLDGIVTHRVTLDTINDGLDLMRAGKAGRVMVEISK
jgi:S-(hydroxymethyl)glutathione dehydrogenase / alcohol dehydrogenase